ncbi:hypothetical protein OROMI_010237 [Orobanche minor]
MANNIRAVAVILIIAYFILLDSPSVDSTRVPLGKKSRAVGDVNRVVGSSSNCGSNPKKLAFDSKRAQPSPPPPPQGGKSEPP